MYLFKHGINKQRPSSDTYNLREIFDKDTSKADQYHHFQTVCKMGTSLINKENGIRAENPSFKDLSV